MALTGRGLWGLGRPRPYTGRSSTRDLHPMVGGGHGAELRRRGVRIRAAEVLLLLRGPDRGLHRAIRGLDVPCQPLLPPFVLRAGVDHHGPIGRPVERDFALRRLYRTSQDDAVVGFVWARTPTSSQVLCATASAMSRPHSL